MPRNATENWVPQHVCFRKTINLIILFVVAAAIERRKNGLRFFSTVTEDNGKWENGNFYFSDDGKTIQLESRFSSRNCLTVNSRNNFYVDGYTIIILEIYHVKTLPEENHVALSTKSTATKLFT